jgi:hypothetical protein
MLPRLLGQEPEWDNSKDSQALGQQRFGKLENSEEDEQSSPEFGAEKRYARDGVAYTKQEFLEFFGREFGQQKWDSAQAAEREAGATKAESLWVQVIPRASRNGPREESTDLWMLPEDDAVTLAPLRLPVNARVADSSSGPSEPAKQQSISFSECGDSSPFYLSDSARPNTKSSSRNSWDDVSSQRSGLSSSRRSVRPPQEDQPPIITRRGVEIGFVTEDGSEKKVLITKRPLGARFAKQSLQCGMIRVSLVIPNSHADHLGIKTGWTIQQVAGQDMKGEDFATVQEVLQKFTAPLPSN